MFLYEPKNESDYQGYIHSQDNMMITWTYQHLMDVAVANYGRPMTEAKLKKALKEQLDMAVEDMMEGYELCAAKMLEKINKDYMLEEINKDYIDSLPKEFNFKSNINSFEIVYHAIEHKDGYKVSCDSNTCEWDFSKREMYKNLLNGNYEIIQ